MGCSLCWGNADGASTRLNRSDLFIVHGACLRWVGTRKGTIAHRMFGWRVGRIGSGFGGPIWEKMRNSEQLAQRNRRPGRVGRDFGGARDSRLAVALFLRFQLHTLPRPFLQRHRNHALAIHPFRRARTGSALKNRIHEPRFAGRTGLLSLANKTLKTSQKGCDFWPVFMYWRWGWTTAGLVWSIFYEGLVILAAKYYVAKGSGRL